MNVLSAKNKSRALYFKKRFLIVFAISAAFHLLVFLAITSSISIFPNKKHFKSSYKVNLTSLPMELKKQLPNFSPPPKKEKKVKKNIPPPKKKPAKKKKAVPVAKIRTKPSELKKEPVKTDSIDEIAKTENKTETFSMDDSKDGTHLSGSMQIDSTNFPYLYYLKIVRDKISRNWFPPFGVVTPGTSKFMIIYFHIAANGQTSNVTVEESSGNSLLDQSAVRAVLVSTPFPPLPFGFTDENLGIHFRFVCYR